MLGTIGLRRLRITCVIGTGERERRHPQQLELDLEVDLDLSKAVVSDDLPDTLDYQLLAERLQRLSERGQFFLIEAFAAAAAGVLLDTWKAVLGVRIEVRKPGAVEAADHAFCRLERRRS